MTKEKDIRTAVSLEPGYIGVVANMTVYNPDGTYNDYKCLGADEATAWKGMAIELAKLVPHGEA